ncbi:MAG: patatin-like phospholipase family protein [Solirubrobacteraceae bacterium]
MRALVISGGGGKGAYAGGIVEYLIHERKIKYDAFLGTSSGSLLLPMIALNKISDLKNIFCNVSQDDIFDVSPFKLKRSPIGQLLTGISHLNIIRQFINRKKTFGESNNLRKLISKNFTKDLYQFLVDKNINIVVTVSNLTTNELEYKSILENSYEDFIDWIWISCNFVPFMTLVKKNHHEYADGGFGKFAPISKAIALGATHIDAIILETSSQQVNYMPSTNAFNLMIRSFDFVMNQLYISDLEKNKLEATLKGITINYYHVPRVLTNMALVFESNKLNNWWIEGFNYAEKQFNNH